MEAFTLYPIESQSTLKLNEFFTWGGSMVRTPDSKCHLFFSLWPRAKGFESWVTDSEIGYAVADNPLGPYELKKIILSGSGKADAWDRDVTHNPTVMYFDSKYYLYYTGNRGNGEYWTHRNNQRIGVAVANKPEGPWERFDTPLLDVAVGKWDSLLTTNPSVTRNVDGNFIMVYKAAGTKSPAPMYGPILHGVAFSESPLGPFKRCPSPIFKTGDANFPGEDPFVFLYNNKLYTILKDIDRFYTSNSRALVLFESDNGIDWKLSPKPLVATRRLQWEDSSEQEFYRLERPQLYQGDDGQMVLFCAVKPEDEKDDSYNIHFKVKINL